MSRILVTGASGTVGQPLVERLRQRGAEVLRATSKRHHAADQTFLDLTDHRSFAPALAGVSRAFVLTPPGFTHQDQLVEPLIEQAARQRLEKLVLMTAMGVDADPTAPLRKAELLLEQSGVPFVVLRPNWFMQNFNSYWLAGIRHAGEIQLPAGTAKGSFIDARDIAAVAAEVLTSDTYRNVHFDLTGNAALDHGEVAGLLARVSGKPIRYRDVSPDEMRSTLQQAGLPPEYAELLLTLLGHFRAGYAERVTAAVPQILGRDAISFEQYASDYRQAWA